jgi:hypothetical protein
MYNNDGNNIEEILLKAGLISPEKLESIKDMAAHAGGDVEKILLKEGISNYNGILEKKAKEMGAGFANKENATIDKGLEKGAIDWFINSIIKDFLTINNVTSISIDREKRSIVVTLSIKY